VKAGKDEKGKPLNTRCLFNHDPNHLLGRFPTTMKMTVDKIGLRYECLLPESRKDIAEMISRGDLRGSSFSFVVAEGGEKWSSENGQSIRLVTRIKSLLDCSPVTYPAYDDATVEIAKRSYEVFSSKKKKIVEVRSNVSSEIEKTRAFLDERRGFCATGPGGGIDNSCGGVSGASSKEDSAWREGGKVGAVIGAAVGTIGGAAGIGAGAAIGAVTGAVAGLFGKQSQEKLEDAYKATGTSLAKADKVAKILDKPMVVSAGEGGSLVMKGEGVTVEVHPGEKETGVPKYMVLKGVGSAIGGKGTESAGRLAASVTKAAKQMGVDMVIVHADGAADGQNVGAFQDAGYSYSLSDDATEVTLTKSIPKSKSRRSYEELMKFYESRGFCPTGKDGGVDNSCGGGVNVGKQSSDKYMEWSKGKDKEAQDFIDKARKDQTLSAGKDGGKSDDGGGVQTWSKGDSFPWTVKQVGDTDGHVQGQHPDGSKTEKYPFKGGKTSDALKKVSDEIKRRKGSRADQVVADTLKFLKDRRA
jgi:HK97 family phage prohead protease